MAVIYEGVLDLDAGTQASRADVPARTAFTYILYYVVAPLLAIVIVIALFVLLRNWSYSPVYKIFTWQ